MFVVPSIRVIVPETRGREYVVILVFPFLLVLRHRNDGVGRKNAPLFIVVLLTDDPLDRRLFEEIQVLVVIDFGLLGLLLHLFFLFVVVVVFGVQKEAWQNGVVAVLFGV